MRKNCSFLSVVVVFAFLALTAVASADPYVCGDADASGQIDIDDVVFLINHIFAGGPAPDPNCCEPDDCPPTVADYDGNTYFTMKIGDQCWMAQNLKVTHYRNGDPIPNVTDGGTWAGLTSGAYCNYNNDEGNVATYGRLYNWYAVDDSRNIAPAGWHVPTDEEWQALVDYLGGAAVAGGKLKEAGTTHWSPPNTGATNESGFSSLPGGFRFLCGTFYLMGHNAIFWSSTEHDSLDAWSRGLDYYDSRVYRSDFDKPYGFSVRCVRD